MSNPVWVEIPIFVHGITSDEKPGSHHQQYEGLLRLINVALHRKGKPQFDQPLIGVEWGWDSGISIENDRYLAAAELAIGHQLLVQEQAHTDVTLNPARLVHAIIRRLFPLGFADLFYYVSQDGEAAVRNNVFKCLTDDIYQRKLESGARVSLTIFAHSAGTVVVHDLLYHLFRPNRASQVGGKVNDVRDLAQSGQLRVRKLYTMGSPIAPLAIRAASTLLKVKDGERLDPEDIGLRRADGLPNPRWINFWDKDDVFSYPVAFLYQADGVVPVIADRYTDLGDIFPDVHGAYWTSNQIAEQIADTLW